MTITPELLTDADLADAFGVTAQKIGEWRRVHGWSHVKVGRAVRYTPAQVEQIIASHSREQREAVAPAAPVELEGQTKRSANHRRAS